MTFEEILDQAIAMLQRRVRVSYRALQRQFALDDASLDDLKEAILFAHPQVVEEAGRGLVWTSEAGATLTPTPGTPQPVAPPVTQDPQPGQMEIPSPESQTPEAERRQLTVLFCDLVDSTVLASQLDPEEWREVVRAYQDTCAKVIARFEGHIAQYLGDGLLVYFGYPLAHEDDAQRAVRTGLDIVDALGQLNARLVSERGIQVAVRMGIHTGLVVVGEMGAGARHESLALGETPNLAARLQGLAAPDSVVISAATFRLIQGLFECHALGPQTLKGVSTPLGIYRVLRESGAQSRLEVAGPTGLTPLVGREQEVGLLLERWAQVREGLGQVVWLSGEPGIGKSRLVQVLKDHVANEPHHRWECRCSPYHQNSAFYPLIDLWQRVWRLTSDDAPEEKLRKLEEALAPYPVSLPEVIPLFASLLSLPLPDRYPPLSLPPQRQKQQTLEAVLSVLRALAARQPLLFIVEDLHWGDPSSLELLSLLIDQGPTARILTVLVFRPEFHPPWGFRAHVTPLTLARIPHYQTEVMVGRVAGGKGLPAEVCQQIVAKTDGVPLFVEELTKLVLESGLLRERADAYELTGPLPALAIPATLHDSLMARLDRLATGKEVAQLGATLGRSFPYDLLQAVAPWDEATLQHALARLVEAELLYQRGLPPAATYLFKHALIQEAAYQSVLRSRRQQVHQRIAQVLEDGFPDTAQTQPELLAHHYTEAGLAAPAVPCWLRAGQHAVQRSANVEAIAHLIKGLEVLKTLPETSERTQQELDFQITLGPVLMSTKGFTAPEVERTYRRARELCQQVEEAPQLVPTLWGLWRFYAQRGELQTALELGEQVLTLAQRVRDPALLLQGHHAVGPTLFYMGELASAQAHLTQGISLYDPQQHRSSLLYGGHDPGMCCQDYAAFTLWVLGFPDQALQQSYAALRLAEELAHPFTLAIALTFAALLHQFRREAQAAQGQAEAAMALCRENGFEEFGVYGRILQGWAMAEQGRREEGVAQMREGVVAWGARGVELYRDYQLVQLAEAYGQVGEAEEGLRVLGEALAIVHNTGGRFYEAELYRLKGELLLQQAVPDAPQAEACFQQAHAVARRQQAKSLELRAAMSLARLWQRQGKRAAARELLAPIYGWFTEGFDTADLQDAKALLEEISK